MIKTNDELRQAVNDAIKESGVTKTALAKKLADKGLISSYKKSNLVLMMLT